MRHWKLCATCNCEMVGVPNVHEAPRDQCHDCGGISLIEQTPQRIEAKRTLNDIYAGMKNPPGFGCT